MKLVPIAAVAVALLASCKDKGKAKPAAGPGSSPLPMDRLLG